MGSPVRPIRVLSLTAAVVAAASILALAPASASRPAAHFAIAFERSGGGAHPSVETLVVTPGLHAYATAPKGDVQAAKHFKMNADTAEELRRELAAAHFSSLRSRPLPASCPYCTAYSITYQGHTVLYPDAKTPRGLDEVIDGLEEEVILHLYRHVGYL